MRAATASRSRWSTGRARTCRCRSRSSTATVRVLLAKNAAGALASTAAQVAAAIEAGSPGLIDRAHPYRTNAGTGIVAATTAPIVLTDFLDQKRTGAPAGEVPRGPYTIRALRIGKHRDGSKPGVLIQASDHAREWVPMTITLETAERLVANYPRRRRDQGHHREHRHLPGPVQQPGRRELLVLQLRVPAPEHDQPLPGRDADPGNRNAWGVDLNRNYRVGSGFDGYDGASTSCTSDTFQGPSKLSEPEAKNAIWLVEQNRNIKFMMSVHSNGGQLFWQPGAYIANGRITTPRPPLGHESFYWQSANRILSQVRATPARPSSRRRTSAARRTSCTRPRATCARTCTSTTASSRSAGRSAARSTTRPPATSRAARSSRRGSARPTWSAATARRWSTPTASSRCSGSPRTSAATRPARRPRSRRRARQFDSPTAVKFETSEPATIYYTTDGTAPTMHSPRYKQTEFREPGEELWVDKTTTFKWFSVDAAGNVEPAGYDPNNPSTANNYRIDTIKIGEEGGAGGTVPATLSARARHAGDLPAFTPGVAREYEASTTANVISTAGDATLSVAARLPTPATSSTARSRCRELQGARAAEFSKSRAPRPPTTTPVTNDPVTITFKQAIKANDALRTGTYSKTLTFTLSTTNP